RPRLLRSPDLVRGAAPDVDEGRQLQRPVDRGGDDERPTLTRAQITPPALHDHVDHLPAPPKGDGFRIGRRRHMRRLRERPLQPFSGTSPAGLRHLPVGPTVAIRPNRRGDAMLTEERMVVREAARYWWVFLVSGIAWLVIAWMVLRFDTASVKT